MTVQEIVTQLESLGSESYSRILLNHGVREPVLGVKIPELKKLHKQIKGDHELVLGLYETGIYDAQYLAGLAVDDARMTKPALRRWLARANSNVIRGTIIAWVAAGSKFGRELGMEWIEAKSEDTALAGWSTLSSLVAIRADEELDLAELESLLERVQKSIHSQPNLVRYEMNGFVIAVGMHVSSLTGKALAVGERMGAVDVDMGNTACEVPAIAEALAKARKRGTIGKKRKTAKC